MNHDIVHCKGQINKLPNDELSSRLDVQICPKRETCYRYLAYLDAQNTKMQYISIILPKEVPCTRYWPNK